MGVVLKNRGTHRGSNKIIFTFPFYNDEENIFAFSLNRSVFFPLSYDVTLEALFVRFTAVHCMIYFGGSSN